MKNMYARKSQSKRPKCSKYVVIELNDIKVDSKVATPSVRELCITSINCLFNESFSHSQICLLYVSYQLE